LPNSPRGAVSVGGHLPEGRGSLRSGGRVSLLLRRRDPIARAPPPLQAQLWALSSPARRRRPPDVLGLRAPVRVWAPSSRSPFVRALVPYFLRRSGVGLPG